MVSTRPRHAEVCIIGGGPAGLSLGLEVSSRGLDTVVLESGRTRGHRGAEMLSVGEHAGRLRAPLHELRKRAVGGTSRAWTGNLARLDRRDFDRPDAAWPIDPGALDTHLDRALRRLGAEVTCTDLDTAAAARSNHELLVGAAQSPLAVTSMLAGRGADLGADWSDELTAAARLRILPESHVLAIVTDGGAKARSVRGVTDGEEWSIEADHVIVATGGIEAARLLLASRQPGHETGLGNHSDHLGRWYQDHPFSWCGVIETDDDEALRPLLFPTNPDRSSTTIAPVVVEQPGTLDALGLPQTALLLLQGHDWMADAPFASAANDEVRRMVRAVANRHVPVQPFRSLATIVRGADDLVRLHRGRRDSRGDRHVVRAQIEPTPRPDSRITLSSRSDRFGVPMARVDWRLGDPERHSTAHMMQRLSEALEGSGLGRFLPGPLAADGWPANLEHGYHPSGTTRLSASPDDGVVDEFGRVHGFDNLWVNSSSVFPTIGWANPTLTVIALGLRLADRLVGSAPR